MELVGPPGVGKSWVARRWAEATGDVVSVSLDGVGTTDGVVHELAVQLGVDDAQQAFRALAARGPTAWVLDDAEEAAEALRDLQERFPLEVPLVVTSRRRIGLSGAAVVDVGPLAADDAFALFVARAREARHGFDPDVHRDAIRALCDELDGLPLALELAAARVRVLNPAQILERLSLDHLKDRRRTGRHQSLRQALADAVDGLSPEARRMLAVASVFQGAFSLEALEAAGANRQEFVTPTPVAEHWDDFCTESEVKWRLIEVAGFSNGAQLASYITYMEPGLATGSTSMGFLGIELGVPACEWGAGVGNGDPTDAHYPDLMDDHSAMPPCGEEGSGAACPSENRFVAMHENGIFDIVVAGGEKLLDLVDLGFPQEGISYPPEAIDTAIEMSALLDANGRIDQADYGNLLKTDFTPNSQWLAHGSMAEDEKLVADRTSGALAGDDPTANYLLPLYLQAFCELSE